MYTFSETKPQMVAAGYGSKYWFPGYGFDSGPNLQPCNSLGILFLSRPRYRPRSSGLVHPKGYSIQSWAVFVLWNCVATRPALHRLFGTGRKMSPNKPPKKNIYIYTYVGMKTYVYIYIYSFERLVGD